MRSYYDKEWHCDCEPVKHTTEKYIQALKNIFDTDRVWLDSDKKFIHVSCGNSCILASHIFNAEFHGMILESIYAQKSDIGYDEVSLMFENPITPIINGDAQ